MDSPRDGANGDGTERHASTSDQPPPDRPLSTGRNTLDWLRGRGSTDNLHTSIMSFKIFLYFVLLLLSFFFLKSKY